MSTHRAVLELLPTWRKRNPSVEVYIYEDLPYSSNDYLEVFERLNELRKSHEIEAVYSDISDTWADKWWAVGAYQSQPYRGYQIAVAQYGTRVGAETGARPAGHFERLWRIV